MVALGIVYLAFERRILAGSRSKDDTAAPAENHISRALLGAQVRNFAHQSIMVTC